MSTEQNAAEGAAEEVITQIDLTLSYAAMQALVAGGQISTVAGPGLEIRLSADDAAMEVLRGEIAAFLLRYSPAGGLVH